MNDLNALNARLKDLDERVLWTGYALSKQVPSMERELDIETAYGTLHLEGLDALRVARLVQMLLQRRLALLNRHQAKVQEQIQRHAPKAP